jgi:hypothetical protein
MSEKEWEVLLDRSPGDPELRLLFATWLQDECDDVPHADFHRWLIAESKWPTSTPLNREEIGWYWSHEPITDPVKHATLGPWAEEHLPRLRWLYPTRRAAEDALFLAWKCWKAALKAAPQGDDEQTTDTKEGRKRGPST